MEHCPGNKNIAANLLSRQNPEKEWEKERDITKTTINALRYECSRELKNDIKNIQLQQEDVQISRVIQALEKGREHTTRFRIKKRIIYQKTPEGDKI